MRSVALITPTGGRPEAWALCERWMSRQTFQAWDWLIVDDCDPPQDYTLPKHQTVFRPDWRWAPGDNTQARNLRYLLDEVAQAGYSRIFVIEDDDYYSPKYLESLLSHLDANIPLVGEGRARYYCLRTKTWKIHENRQHACLCRTAFRSEMISALYKHVRDEVKIIDRPFWKEYGRNGKIITNKWLSVGIKGMPGRNGIGGGHWGHPSYVPDYEGKVLRKWLGDDAKVYAPFLIQPMRSA